MSDASTLIRYIEAVIEVEIERLENAGIGAATLTGLLERDILQLREMIECRKPPNLYVVS
jgi:hypothetical protein